MPRQILLLNGPNLNLLGTREPELYGTATLDDITGELRRLAAARDAELSDEQSNGEGALVDLLHDARSWADGVLFNPGGYAHTSVALRDAITATGLDVVEVHVSNVAAREPFRHTSTISAVCVGVVSGFGADGYAVALEGLLRHLDRTRGGTP